VRNAEIEIKISWLKFRANGVPATVIDVGARLIKNWPCRDGISHTSKGNLLPSCFMFNSCPESLMFALITASIPMSLIGISNLHMIWAEHVKVAKRQEGITNDALCTRRQGRTNELLIRGTRGSRFGTEVGLGIVVIGLKVSGHVVGCVHVLSRS
jgi:hypothetical protein